MSIVQYPTVRREPYQECASGHILSVLSKRTWLESSAENEKLSELLGNFGKATVFEAVQRVREPGVSTTLRCYESHVVKLPD